jgi:hypothetical protein
MNFHGPGVDLIAKERSRQVKVEGFTVENDDQYIDHEMAMAAVCYAAPKPLYLVSIHTGVIQVSDPWPAGWEEMDKREFNGFAVPRASELPLEKRIRNLAKAGALIAAEIDRLIRTQKAKR